MIREWISNKAIENGAFRPDGSVINSIHHDIIFDRYPKTSFADRFKANFNDKIHDFRY